MALAAGMYPISSIPGMALIMLLMKKGLFGEQLVLSTTLALMKPFKVLTTLARLGTRETELPPQ